MSISNEYIYFPDGSIGLGINTTDVDGVVSSILHSKIKREHIAASSPQKKINYNQFYIKKNLVSVSSFKSFVENTSYITESEKEGWGWIWNNRWIKEKYVSWRKPFLEENQFYSGVYSEDFPVMQVTWNDAVEYTKWLSIETGNSVRLPYEYEWEVLGNYAGLNSVKNLISDENMTLNSDKDFVLELKSKLDNSEYQLGLLWEWTLDWYDGYDVNIVNKDFGNIYKTLRGGSLLSENVQKSKEFRFRRCPTARSPYYGFRIVIDIM